MKPDAGEPLTQDSFMIEMVSGSIAGMNRTTVIYALASGQGVAEDTIADVEASGLWPGKVVTIVEPQEAADHAGMFRHGPIVHSLASQCAWSGSNYDRVSSGRSDAGRAPRSFPRPSKMHGVGPFKFGISGLGETQMPFLPSVRSNVCGIRGNEIQIVHVKSENAQEPGQTRQVAVNDLLQVRDAAAAPFLQIVAAQQLHSNEHINRSNDLVPLKDDFDRAAYLRKQRVVTKCCDCYSRHLMI